MAEIEKAFLQAIKKRGDTPDTFFSACIRDAIDQILDGPNTGRYLFSELSDRPEKTFVGGRIEDLIRDRLSLERGLDSGFSTDLALPVAGKDYPVDVKTSASAFGWMFPVEAARERQVCLVIHYNDGENKPNLPASTFSAGLLQIEESLLTQSGNRDGKRSLLASKRDAIHWILRDEPLQANFVRAALDKGSLDFHVFKDESFSLDERMAAFARHATTSRAPFPREVFETCGIAQELAVRELYDVSSAMGLSLFCGSLPDDQKKYPHLKGGQYLLDKK